MVLAQRAQLTLDGREALWAQVYARRQTLLSASGDTAYLLVPMADQTHDTGLVTTTLGTEQVDFTYSQSQSVFDFDTPPSYLGSLGIPQINFNGSDEFLETPDTAFWNDSAGSSEPSYCWAFWVNIVESTTFQALLIKSTSIDTSGQDWVTYINSNERFVVRIMDDSANAYIGRRSSVLSDGWHHLVCTKADDNVSPGLSTDINIYVDGVLDNDQITESGTYDVQEDGTNVVRIGATASGAFDLSHSLIGGPLGPVFRAVGTNAVWTPDAIRRDYQLGRALIGPAGGL